MLDWNHLAGRASILFLTVILAAAQTPPQAALYPVDDTPRDRTFQAFVQRLRSAVEDRDTKALRKLVDTDEVVVGRDKEDKGWRKFVAKWHPDDREDRGLWTALSEMLAAGFVREHPRLYLSPYQVWRFISTARSIWWLPATRRSCGPRRHWIRLQWRHCLLTLSDAWAIQ